ncbi:MAG: glycoside hydrolase family 3 N-terminal domain-containing protein, partial [Anaerolineae bacterium]
SMALGATWNRALAEATGQVVGQELAVLGFNFYLGPDLDVMYEPLRGDPANLGTNVFGGNPYWVGELGRAYIRGIHQGSEGGMAVFPRHFPGIGAADRPVEEEVPTVQKSLEQLKEVDLAPFYAAANGVPGAANVADGFLVTHSRYSGLQGSIRSSTRPVSLDAQALQQALASVAGWREGGGLLVADNLALRSVRRFDDPWGLTFNARRVARDALLAGNDLLIMDRFAASEAWADHFVNVRDTLDFLAQRYEEDSTFRERVDEALYRILSLKMALYPRFSLGAVQPGQATLQTILNESPSVVGAQVSTNALTRLIPVSDDLLPPSPQEGERFAIVTQEHPVTLGEGVTVPELSRELVGEALLQLYGPNGTGQVRVGAVQQFTFSELLDALETPLPAEEDDPAYIILAALQEADWIIFAATDLVSLDTGADALSVFLEQQAERLNGRIVVLDFGLPYGLDSTEISKLDLYYALYSADVTFVQAGTRALFRDLPAVGAAPITISALNYDLALHLRPDPNQTISLTVVDESGQEMSEEAKNNIRKDDIIYLRTSVIVDHNGNPVPDGTPVDFVLTYPQEDRQQILTTETSNGVALTSVSLDRVGQLDITAKSEPVPPFFHLQLTIREGQSVIMISITPTPEPEEPVSTATPEVESEGPEALPEPLHLPAPHRYQLMGWGMVGATLVGLLGFVWAHQGQGLDLTLALRTGLWGIIGGLAVYVLLILSGRWLMPGWLYHFAGREFLMGVIALLSGGLALGGVWLVRWTGIGYR